MVGSKNIFSGFVIFGNEDDDVSFWIKTAFDSLISFGKVPSKCIFLIAIYPHLKSVVDTFVFFEKCFSNQLIVIYR